MNEKPNGIVYRCHFPDRTMYIGSRYTAVKDFVTLENYRTNSKLVWNLAKEWYKGEEDWWKNTRWEILDEFYGKENISIRTCGKETEHQVYFDVVRNNLYRNQNIHNIKCSFSGSHTEEWKVNHSNMMKGKKNPMYGISGEKSPNFGKKRSNKTKNAISSALKGKRNGMFGRKGKDHPCFGKQQIHPFIVHYVDGSFEYFKRKSDCKSIPKTTLQWLKNNPPKEFHINKYGVLKIENLEVTTDTSN